MLFFSVLVPVRSAKEKVGVFILLVRTLRILLLLLLVMMITDGCNVEFESSRIEYIVEILTLADAKTQGMQHNSAPDC